MPNYCDNSLIITGKESILDAIRAFIKSEENEFDFVKVVPMPAEEEGNWYNWCCENWGTKWNSESVILEQFEECLKISFLSAWAPPIPVISALAKKFPAADFELSYYEAGMCFCGVNEYHNGEETYEMEGDFSFIPNWLCEEDEEYEIPDELYPVMPSGIVDDVENEGSLMSPFHYREYSNNKLVCSINGVFAGKPKDGYHWPQMFA